jgi:hypothetical protein
MEAISGVAPQLHTKANSIWAGFGKGIWPDDWWAKGMKIEVNTDWLDLLVETTQYCVEQFSDNFDIAQTSIMRGSIDVVAALIGDENCVVAMYEHPNEFHRLMGEATDVIIRVMKA